MKDFTRYCGKCSKIRITWWGGIQLCDCDHEEINKSINSSDFNSLSLLIEQEKELSTLILQDLEKLLKNE